MPWHIIHNRKSNQQGRLALRVLPSQLWRAWRALPPTCRAPQQRCQASRAAAGQGFPEIDVFVVEGSPAAGSAAAIAEAGSMGDGDKRTAEGAAEGGPAAKKAATVKLAVNPKRVRELRRGAVAGEGPVIYW